jgi:hypothetical protein
MMKFECDHYKVEEFTSWLREHGRDRESAIISARLSEILEQLARLEEAERGKA